MKKKIAVIRFGSVAPTKSDVIAVVEKLELNIELGEVLGCPIPGGMATLIFTDKTIAEVKQAFDEAAVDNSDELPIIVLDEEGLKGTTLNSMGFEDFKRMSDFFDREFGTGSPEGKNCTMSLDELLDLVNQVGVHGLDEAQFARLKELSQRG